MENTYEAPLDLRTRKLRPVHFFPVVTARTWFPGPADRQSEGSTRSQISSPGRGENHDLVNHPAMLPPREGWNGAEVSSPRRSEDQDVVYHPPTRESTGQGFRTMKPYTKNPLMFVDNADAALPFEDFREQVLQRMHVGETRRTNENMRRVQPNQQSADPDYREKRRKNNEAAKRSRDNRRAQEEDLLIRCAYLEKQNYLLKCELRHKEQECAALRVMRAQQRI